jgi:hypothetical protein
MSDSSSRILLARVGSGGGLGGATAGWHGQFEYSLRSICSQVLVRRNYRPIRVRCCRSIARSQILSRRWRAMGRDCFDLLKKNLELRYDPRSPETQLADTWVPVSDDQYCTHILCNKTYTLTLEAYCNTCCNNCNVLFKLGSLAFKS